MRGRILLGALVVMACSADPNGSSLTGGGAFGAGGGSAGGGSSGATQPSGQGNGNGNNGAPSAEPQLDATVVLSEIAFFQTVKVSVMKDGSAPTRKAPIVAGREALVRAYVTPAQGYAPHEVTARLVIDGATMDAKLTPSAASTEADLGSTFNFKLTGAQLGAASKIKIALLDAKKMGPPASAAPSTSRWPADGTQATVDARSSGAQIKVVVVPIRYGADGSNRLPDTSANQIQTYAQTMYALYPTPKVDVQVRQQPMSINFAVGADGTGWNQLLTALLQLRASDAPGADVYYYGAFAPAASMQAYCAGGCVAGLSPVVMSVADAASRGSIGLGFTGAGSATTMAHEVGHAHGLPHAPCGGASGTDPNFPYQLAGIGSWGYSATSQQLVSPMTSKDVMSYCSPQWISDYNFNLLFNRVKAVNGAAIVQGPPAKYRYAALEKDGSIVVIGEGTLTLPPAGQAVAVRFSDGFEGTAYFYPSDHVSGGTLLLPNHPGEVWVDRASLVREEGFIPKITSP